MKLRRKFHRFGEGRTRRGSPGPAAVADEETSEPRQIIEQAARDISRGLCDTDLHGIPSNVPGPGPAPEQSPGAEVPAEGINVRK